MQLNEVQSALAFHDFMMEIWDGTLSAVDGGVLIVKHNHYDEYHDASRTVNQLGWRKLWGYRVAEKPGYAWEAPDGSRIGVATDGSATQLINRR